MTNTVDNVQYFDLLDYIAAFVIPERGKGWKVMLIRLPLQNLQNVILSNFAIADPVFGG